MKPVRLIAMDMDGTLLNSRQELTQENVNALKAAQRQGVKLAICSGRSPGDNALFALENGFPDCAILSLNGAYCLESAAAQAPYANHLMARDTALQALRWLREAAVTTGCFLQNNIVIFPGQGYQPEGLFWCSHLSKPGAPVLTEGEEAFQRAFESGLNKFICIDDDLSRLSAVQKRLQTLPGLEITSSWPQELELMPQNVNKGRAVGELALKLGLTADEVMTLGDYDNDLTMIRYAGYGVAMGNAADCVKAAASYQTLSNDENGVAAAIRRFVLS